MLEYDYDEDRFNATDDTTFKWLLGHVGPGKVYVSGSLVRDILKEWELTEVAPRKEQVTVVLTRPGGVRKTTETHYGEAVTLYE